MWKLQRWSDLEPGRCATVDYQISAKSPPQPLCPIALPQVAYSSCLSWEGGFRFYFIWAARVFYFLLCITTVTLQTFAIHWPHWGRCPDLSVKQDFSLIAYKGPWFEQAGYNTESVEGDKRCVSALYYIDDDMFYVQNRGIDNRNNKWGGVNGTAKFTNPAKKEAKLTVSFKFGWLTVNGPYWVLDTDYNTYSVVYTCENFLFLFHHYTVWLLSRNRSLSTVTQQQLFYNATYSVLTERKLPSALIQKADQTNCNV
ncbi:apolipoprotein D-like [Macrosteles quadrilineatus]|uniref:apolipoprotein D-like n=1 Tax=Macrosteles quadrilineatus TaxID=74068 RepID=UPI0023E25B69|nr:apolipoprotein D-like [Macrosteles quadrilineatus]XP_054289855.1 apolipoprotein D-like [Macrosteles quadrilineatus]